MTQESERFIEVGRVVAVYGVRGWVKIHSYTEPPANILDYVPWYLDAAGQQVVRDVAEGREHGKVVVARFDGCTEREQAAQLVGMTILVRREQLPAPEEGEYYWADLIGMRVINTQGVEFGTVVDFMETGANDVVVVKGERDRLIPYTADVIQAVDIKQRVLSVDWDPEF